jgi:hypothetical protein
VDVDGGLVAVAGGTADLDELAGRSPQSVDLGGDLLGGYFEGGPDSSPEVMSMSGWSMGSTSVSVTARA